MAIHIPFSANTYVERRQTLMKKIGSGQVLLIANEESSINFADNWNPYRQDSTFLYYGAIALPHIAMIIDADSGKTMLFADDVSIDMVIWTGPQPTMSSIGEKVGISEVYPYADITKYLKSNVSYLPPYRASQEKTILQLTGHSTIANYPKLIQAIASQRSIKTDEEVVEINEAVGLSKGMHAEVIKNIRPGIFEYELVGIASRYAYDNNARFAFPPILTKNGQTLHNHYHGHKIEKGDLVLVDGGIEISSGYCGDITRTTPASGSFTTEQQEIYDLVHAMYKEAAKFAKAGERNLDVHLHAAKVLVEGMKDIGLMKGDADEAVKEGAHAMFFQHGLGHLMGLDVHDMENFGEANIGYDESIQKSTQFGLKSLRLGKTLEAGNVITIEPGIYFIPQLIDKFRAENRFADFINYDLLEKKKNLGGIRIEDDFLIEENACRMLGGDNPMP